MKTRHAGSYVLRMRSATEACGARFLMAMLPGPVEATYGQREPATEKVLAPVRAADVTFPIADLRVGIPLGSRFNIPALDYPNARGAAWIAGRLSGPVRQALAKG